MDMKSVGSAIALGAGCVAREAFVPVLCALASKVNVLPLLEDYLSVVITAEISGSVCYFAMGKGRGLKSDILIAVAHLAITVLVSPHLARYIFGNRLSYIQSAAFVGLGSVRTPLFYPDCDCYKAPTPYPLNPCSNSC